jgi:hypothetical protein
MAAAIIEAHHDDRIKDGLRHQDSSLQIDVATTTRPASAKGESGSSINERVKGIEPSQPAWKAGTLPLSYTR